MYVWVLLLTLMDGRGHVAAVSAADCDAIPARLEKRPGLVPEAGHVYAKHGICIGQYPADALPVLLKLQARDNER